MSDQASPALAANHVIRGALTASLATMQGSGDGDRIPYASLVLIATMPDGRPVMLLSTLAEHTKNLSSSRQISLLCDGTAGLRSPLTGPRVTVQGELLASDSTAARARFLARHHDAGQYADFGDFQFYVLEPTRVHLVAGFGAIHWIYWAEVSTPIHDAGEVIEGEASILDHMNADHRDAMTQIAAAAGAPAGDWIMTGCDPAGCDLRSGGRALRVPFAHPLRSLDDVRAELVRLTRDARGS